MGKPQRASHTKILTLPDKIMTNPVHHFSYLLKDLSRLYSLNFERHAAEQNVTLAQGKILLYLRRNEGISQVRLAYLTDISPMMLGRILESFERDGLIKRSPDPYDQRIRRLYLKPAAIPVLKEIRRILRCVQTETLSGLTAEERAQVMELMQRMHSNLDALNPGAADYSKENGRTKTRKKSRRHAKTK